MIPAYPDVVETSSNLAIITIDANKTYLKVLVRSAREDMREYLATTDKELFRPGRHENRT